eukprot:4587603-Pyramimonas_sp.AAC.1
MGADFGWPPINSGATCLGDQDRAGPPSTVGPEFVPIATMACAGQWASRPERVNRRAATSELPRRAASWMGSA